MPKTSPLPEPDTTLPGTGLPLYRMEVERLPDLNIPRNQHTVAYVNGELVVFGGSTTGFVFTPTAEYFSGGTWHTIPMLYNHSAAFLAILPSGEVMLGGGCKEDFGIGQTWGAELYDPVTHSFSPLPNLARSRALANSALLPDGTLVICGNWYADDAVEFYRPGEGFSFYRELEEPFAAPYIFPTKAGDALIFSATDPFNRPSGTQIQRLKGDSFPAPLLEEYCPLPASGGDFNPDFYRAEEDTYLVPLLDKNGRLAIGLLRDGQFSLLPTDHPFPDTLDGEPIQANRINKLFVNRDSGKAFLQVVSPSGGCYYFFCLAYKNGLKGGNASLSVYKTEALTELSVGTLTLLPDGKLVQTGGGPASDMINFLPYASVYLFYPATALMAQGRNGGWWLLLLIPLAAGFVLLFRRKKGPAAEGEMPMEKDTVNRQELMNRIKALMEEQELFRRKELRILDVAKLLGTNVTYISACINNEHGGSFNHFVNIYRVEFAKKWLLEHPDKKIAEAGEEAGFSSEASFFRNFKAVTGLTPTEWISKGTGR